MLPVESSQPHHLLPISVFSSTSNHSTDYQILAWQDQAQVLSLPHRAHGSNEFTTSSMARRAWIQSLVGPFSAVPSNKANAPPSLALPRPLHCLTFLHNMVNLLTLFLLALTTPTHSVNSPHYTWSSMKAELYFLQFHDVPAQSKHSNIWRSEWNASSTPQVIVAPLE